MGRATCWWGRGAALWAEPSLISEHPSNTALSAKCLSLLRDARASRAWSPSLGTWVQRAVLPNLLFLPQLPALGRIQLLGALPGSGSFRKPGAGHAVVLSSLPRGGRELAELCIKMAPRFFPMPRTSRKLLNRKLQHSSRGPPLAAPAAGPVGDGCAVSARRRLLRSAGFPPGSAVPVAPWGARLSRGLVLDGAACVL